MRIEGNVVNKKRIWVFSLVLVIIHSFGLTKRYVPWFTDEIGYWASAALMKGYNWREVMSTGGYYGYGYGIVLSLIINISNIHIRFHCAQFINVVLVVVTYILLVRIICKIFAESTESICFVCMCYPYIQVYTHLSMAEIALTCIYVISVYALLRFNEERSIKWSIVIGICVFVMFSIHLRSLVALLGLLIILLVTLISEKNKKNKINVLVGVLISIIALAVVWKIKDYVVESLYTVITSGNQKLEQNKGNSSFSSYIWMLSNIFKLDFWKLIFKSFEGKFFYSMVASFTLTFISSIWILKSLFNSSTIQKPVLLYIFFSYWGEVALTIISMFNVGRFDNLMYGRYSEAFILPILCIGTYLLCNGKYKIKDCMINIILMLLLSIDMFQFIQNNEFKPSLDMAMCSVSGWNITNISDIEVFYVLGVVSIITGVTILLCVMGKRTRKGTLVVLVLIWFIVGQNCLKNNVYNGYWTADKLEETTIAIDNQNKNEKIYYLLPEETNDMGSAAWRDMLFLQYMLVDKIIYVVDESEISKVKENEMLLIEKNISGYEQYVDKDKVIHENELIVVMVK